MENTKIEINQVRDLFGKFPDEMYRSYQRVWDVIDPWHSDRSYQRVWDVIDPWHSECFLKSSDPLNPDYCECED